MKQIYLIDKNFENLRIDKWVKKEVIKIPQNFLEKNLRKKNITVNNLRVKSSYKLKFNDKVYFKNFQPKENPHKEKRKYLPNRSEIKSSNDFIIEDNENFCVINKPAGLAVQGGTKITKNLIDILRKNERFKEEQPYIVHRIDRETSGILLVAKTKKYAQLFTSLFRIRKIHKSYLSICSGEFEQKKGVLENNLIRFEQKKEIKEKAKTYFKVLDKNTTSSLLLLNPITGRKHQIRKQLSIINHPIHGDKKYTFSKIKKENMNYLMLHAYSIKFMINNKKYEYRANIPDYFEKMLNIKRLKISKNF